MTFQKAPDYIEPAEVADIELIAQPAEGKPLRQHYVETALPMGFTVHEYEEHLGLPRYSVYPELSGLSFNDKGGCMYELPPDHQANINQSMAMRGLEKDGVAVVGFKEKFKNFYKGKRNSTAGIRPMSNRPVIMPRNMFTNGIGST